MTIVAAHQGAELYGSDRVFLSTARALPDVLVAVPSEGLLTRVLAQERIPFETVEFPVLRRVDLRTPYAALRTLLRFVISIPRLRRWLVERKATTVYVSTLTCPAWLLAARLAGAKVLCHVHESGLSLNPLLSHLLLLPLRLAHVVIVNSRDTAVWVAQNSSKSVGRRIELLYNGVEAPDPMPAPTPRRQGRPHQVVVVGRLSVHKGQDVALAALARLREKGLDVELTLVGDCYPGYEAFVEDLHQRVEALGLTNFVHFAGFVEDPSRFVRGADLVLVPSRMEPFGLVAVEAAMAMRPLIVSDVGGLREIVSDGVNGLLVPPDDPAALAAAAERLLMAPEAAAAMARQACVDAHARFSAASYRSRILEVIAG
jgi:glycosyltransferase involved in cell wall biosynthesis